MVYSVRERRKHTQNLSLIFRRELRSFLLINTYLLPDSIEIESLRIWIKRGRYIYIEYYRSLELTHSATKTLSLNEDELKRDRDEDYFLSYNFFHFFNGS